MERIKKIFNDLSKNFGPQKNIYMDGIAYSPFIFKNKNLNAPMSSEHYFYKK